MLALEEQPVEGKESERDHTVFMSTPSSSFSITLSMPFSKNVHLRQLVERLVTVSRAILRGRSS
jgi:hypothetical protein